MSKKIAILNQDSGYLMIDTANAFAQAGYDVALVSGRLVRRNKSLNEGVKFKKIIRYQRSPAFKRLFTWGIAALQMLLLIWFRYPKRELLIASNPPVAPLLPLLCNNTFSLLIYDVYPEVLTELNMLSPRSPIVKLWQKANKKAFQKAKRIITITEGMKQVLQPYTDNKNIEVIPIWTDNDFLRPVPKQENPFIKNHHWQDKFIVMYSGNLGHSHDVEAIVELAALVKDQQIHFAIIGEGEKKTLLQRKIAEYGLQNVSLLPYQKPENLSFSLSAADIGIVALGKYTSRLSVPSKTYNLMSVGAPLLCIAGQDSELSHLVRHYEIGRCFEAEQLQQMEDYILELKENPDKHKRFSENALKASRDFEPDNATLFVEHDVS